ncbi:MAG: cyclic pyranopterin monophosphate synthase MoaC [Nitrososphaerota archaeon]|nr:cyclic pyranopterin monophosphate synthase MoaC [Nitrososphaerota archaeon]MDG6939571.1 cyclic pyranopterin monophosphate synthase MoaC [Nitrososphaerota archaeon]
MVDISAKPVTRREAAAEGVISLRRSTLRAIKEGGLEKGDPAEIAKVAGIMAVKKTPDLIPLCHNIPIESVEVSVEVEDGGVRVTSRVVGVSKTGVEMEALASVSAALLSIWDVVKKFEKDEAGQYPSTSIGGVRVLRKVRG